MQPEFEVQIRILRPVEAVFDAVRDPKKLSRYFTNGGASAPLDEETEVQWTFEDTPGEPIGPFPVFVRKVILNELITFEWEASAGGYNTLVEMKFTADGPDAAVISIAESGWRETEQGRKDSYGNCMGWSHMQCALKAYLEHGINLREGAYTRLYSAADHATKKTS